MMSFAITLHILASVIWVGGMFFAHFMLRPSALEVLTPEQRLPLWAAVFKRFFFWVWIAAILLPLTGFWITFVVFGGIAGTYIHIMSLTGLIMLGIYTFIFFKPYQGLKRSVAGQDYDAASQHLNLMRTLITANLHLGLLTIIVATAGKYLAI